MTNFEEIISELDASGVSLHGLTVALLSRLEAEQAERQAFLTAKAKRGVRPDRYVPSAAVKRVQDRASKPHARSGKELRRQAERRGMLVRGPSL